MTRAEPLLLTDQTGCPLTCTCSLGRSEMLHQQSAWSPAWAGDISLGWEHQYGIGTPVLDGSLQHLFPPPCAPPSLCCWQMGDSPPSPIWGIRLVAVRAGTAPSVLLQPFVPCAVGKTAVTGKEQLGPHCLCPVCPQDVSSHVTGLSWLGRIGPQALTKECQSQECSAGSPDLLGQSAALVVTRLVAVHRKTEAQTAGRWHIANTSGIPRMLQATDQPPTCPSRLWWLPWCICWHSLSLAH